MGLIFVGASNAHFSMFQVPFIAWANTGSKLIKRNSSQCLKGCIYWISYWWIILGHSNGLHWKENGKDRECSLAYRRHHCRVALINAGFLPVDSPYHRCYNICIWNAQCCLPQLCSATGIQIFGRVWHWRKFAVVSYLN